MLVVNEIYGPVKQGEGKSAGLDVMFLRLSGCNLACIWCDTPYTWNWQGTKFQHPDKFDKKAEVHKMQITQVRDELYAKAEKVRSLVVSGGEPMLQQVQLATLFRKLREKDNWWVEIETNGTIEPTDEVIKLINQFNCSPKTSNAGIDNPIEKRLKPAALQKIAKCGERATFKFVIQSYQDMEETKSIILLTGIKPEQVWLMPEGKTREEQEERQRQVKILALDNGWNFSPRLHILEFGNKRAV